jgi:hypothetical protein
MSSFFDKWLSGPPQANKKPSNEVSPAEHAATPGRAVSGELLEAEIMRVVPMLCNKAEAHTELRPEISRLIDTFLELERAGNDLLLLEALNKAESRFTG